jgi:hypothetical protein
MMKRFLLVGALAMALVVPAAAETPAAAAVHAKLRGVARLFQNRVRRAARHGLITQEGLQRLRADRQALRDKLRAMRQSGGPLTPAQRQDLRNGVRNLRREFQSLRRGRTSGGGQ